MAGTICGYGLAFFTSILIARMLGPAGRGELGTATAPGAILAMLLCVNIQDYFTRAAAIGENPNLLSRQALALSSAMGLVFVLPYVALVTTWQQAGSAVWWLLVIYALSTPVSIYCYCLLAIAAGTGKWTLVSISRFLPNLVCLIGLILAAIAGWGVMGIGILIIFAGLFGPLFLLIEPTFRPSSGGWWDNERAALRYGSRAWPAGAIALLSQRVDLLIVIAIATRSDIGYYAIATNMAAILTAISNIVAMPTRNAVARGDTDIVPRRTSIAIWATGGCAVLAIGVLPLFIEVALGREFVAMMWPAAILIAAEIPLAGAVVLNQALLGAGHPSKPFKGAAAALAVTAVGAASLYPYYGLRGVAFACACGNIANLGLQLVSARRHIGRSALLSYFLPFGRKVVA